MNRYGMIGGLFNFCILKQKVNIYIRRLAIFGHEHAYITLICQFLFLCNSLCLPRMYFDHL